VTRALRVLLRRVAGLFSGAGADRELADELDSHLRMHIDDNIRRGMPPEEARRDALARLGGLDAAKERYRDQRGLPSVDALRRDLSYAVRGLRRNPGFAVTAIVTLALGIGANTAVFSVANAVLLRPLPFPDAPRLVMVYGTDTKRNGTRDVVSYPDYVDWSQVRAFDRTGAYAGGHAVVAAMGRAPSGASAAGGGADAEAGAAEFVRSLRVTASLFDILGARPALGRGFAPAEQEAGAPHVAILGDRLWKRQFAGAPDAIGRSLRVDETPYTIVGVMPPDFEVTPGSPADLYVPLTVDPNRGHGFLRIVARLRPGIGPAQAQGEMNILTERIARRYSKTDEAVGANVMPLAEALVGSARLGLFVLLAVVALVLLIACTNVASLALARGAARRRELAVRAALGASRGRIARQLLTESLVLALAGGGMGLLVGSWTAHALSAVLASAFQGIPRIEATHTDSAVLVFTLALSLTTGLLFGLFPAFATRAPDLGGALRESSRTSTGDRAPRLRSALVIVETALALVLLAGAGVLLRTFVTLRTTPPGFEADHLLTARLWLPRPRFAARAERDRFCDELLGRLRRAPGVVSAAFVADLPLSGDSDGLPFHIPGRPDPAPGQPFSAGFNIATDGYFRTMGIPIRAGREFGDGDGAGAQGVVVVNETAARRFWPGEVPLGRPISLPLEEEAPTMSHEHGREADKTPEPLTLTVVGVAADVRHEGLAEPPRPEFFVAAAQTPLDWPWGSVAVRTTGEPDALAATFKDTVRSVDRNVPILQIASMERILSAAVAAPRVYAILLGAFAALALLLAAVGLYGLLAYTVSQRTQEIGIRVALGARRAEIVRLVLWRALALSAAGTIAGLAAALASTRLLAGLTAGVRATDPLTFAVVPIVLVATALLASLVPARRATRVDPLVALRAE
jgi:predicted permease